MNIGLFSRLALGVGVAVILACLAVAASAQPGPAPAPVEGPSNQLERVPVGGEWTNFDPENAGTFDVDGDGLQKITMYEGGKIVEYFMWTGPDGKFDYRITKDNASPEFWSFLLEAYAEDWDIEIAYDKNGKITQIEQQ